VHVEGDLPPTLEINHLGSAPLIFLRVASTGRSREEEFFLAKPNVVEVKSAYSSVKFSGRSEVLWKSAEIIMEGFGSASRSASAERDRLGQFFQRAVTYPLKVVAAFLASPILVFKMALTVKCPVRRSVAIAGLLLASIFCYFAGTLIGTVAGAFLVASNIGILTGFGFLIGSRVSVFVSVLFCIFIFNAASFLFLKINSQEVVDYLREISR